MTERTINTMNALPEYDVLIAEVTRALSEQRDEGTSIEMMGPELVRLGASIALPVSGPFETLHGIRALLVQLANEFPGEWQQVQQLMRDNGSSGLVN